MPDIALMNINPVNSDYCSITEGNKNCYLVVGGDFNENVMYSSFTFNTKDSVDLHWVSKSDLSYESSDCISCSRLLYSRQCETCLDSAFLFNCKNCSNCFGGVYLRNAQYCFFNEQLNKESYEEKMKSIILTSFSFSPRVVMAGTPMRTPLGSNGLRGSSGIILLLRVIPILSSATSASFPVTPLVFEAIPK